MSDAERLIDADARDAEDAEDQSIRPRLLGDYIGQPAVSEQMEIFIGAARKRADALDHVCVQRAVQDLGLRVVAGAEHDDVRRNDAAIF